MIDEDETIALLEDLMIRHPEPVAPLGGAVLIRPRADRIAVVGGLDAAACVAAQHRGEIPDTAAWWLSLTTWGRLEMWGDVAAAGIWVRNGGR
jgi:hypothetical protein